MRLQRSFFMLPRYLRHTSDTFPATPIILIRMKNLRMHSTVGDQTVITKYQAYDMVHKLSEQDRTTLRQALNQYDSDKIKSQFEGELAATRWRTRFGRRSDLPILGQVDPTGSFCAMPDDWLKKKLAEVAEPPTKSDLRKIMLVNAVPFLGFGFLDNFFMIIAGDYIEHTMGMFMCISTMAAAGLGNTISDAAGLGLAHYVEKFCEFLGMRPPKLTTAQMDLSVCRKVASSGRAIGITVGCILGMFPLLFMGKKKDTEESSEVVVAATTATEVTK